MAPSHPLQLRLFVLFQVALVGSPLNPQVKLSFSASEPGLRQVTHLLERDLNTAKLQSEVKSRGPRGLGASQPPEVRHAVRWAPLVWSRLIPAAHCLSS